VRTITIRGAILVKIENFIPENASFQGYFTEVSFDNSEENHIFSKWVIFQNSLMMS
jgi:hypothetical protein